MMLYLESNKIPYIYFSFHQCDQFTYKTKASHYVAAKSLCQYLQGIKNKGLVFNLPKKLA